MSIAVGVNTDGRREVLGMAIGPSEAETFWTDFLRDLVRRGLSGVKLVISGAVCISSETLWPMLARAAGGWSQRSLLPPSPSPTMARPERSGAS